MVHLGRSTCHAIRGPLSRGLKPTSALSNLTRHCPHFSPGRTSAPVRPTCGLAHLFVTCFAVSPIYSTPGLRFRPFIQYHFCGFAHLSNTSSAVSPIYSTPIFNKKVYDLEFGGFCHHPHFSPGLTSCSRAPNVRFRPFIQHVCEGWGLGLGVWV